MRAADSKLALRATWLATRAAAAVSPRAAGPIAARLWFTPWRIDPGERGRTRQAEWLKDTQPLAFSVDDHRIGGFTAGEGPAIVLAHGWGERAASLGALIAPLVASGYRVVGVDFPAHGASSGGRTDGFEVAAAIRGVCDSIGGAHVIVAHSMAALASMYAVTHGLPVDALVLLAPSTRLDHALERFSEIFALPPNAQAGLKQTIDRRYGPDVWERLSGHVLARTMDVPALIVHDCDDPQVALEDAEELAAAWPEARLVTTDGLGHGRILRDGHVIDEVVSFLRSVKARVEERVEA
ncbi:MAG: alpha/beta hydrolase [Actinomycetota bacterium]|nr:alpha/beta hydrolase [Actinomycetota bacterium]